MQPLPDVNSMLAGLSDSLKSAAKTPNYLNYIANSHQQAFHVSRSRRKLFIGGNRAGKTTGGICEDVGWLTKRHQWRPEIRNYEYPIRGRIICQDLDVLKKNIFTQLRQWIPVSDLVNGSWEDSYTAGERLLKLANGSSLEFKTYEQDVQSHAGTSMHFIHFDEPPPQDVYKENLLRLLDTRDEFDGGGAYWMTFTPTDGMDWTYREIYRPGVDDPENSGIFVIHASVDDNPHISQAAKDELFKGMSDNDIKVRRHGQYVQLSGMVFREWGADHVLSPYDLHDLWGPTMLPPKWWKLHWSIDHGLNNPTAIYWHAINPKTDEIITFHERYMRDVLVRDHAKYVHEFESRMGRTPDYRTGDPAMKQRDGKTGTSILQAYAELGIPIAVDSVPRDPSIGIVRMRQYMRKNPATGKPFWRIYDCPQLDKELQDLHWEKYASAKIAEEKNVKETVHKYRDHGFDSCKYEFTAMPDISGRFPKPNPVEQLTEGTLQYVLAEIEKPPPWRPNSTSGIFRPVAVRPTKWHIEEAMEDDWFNSAG